MEPFQDALRAGKSILREPTPVAKTSSKLRLQEVSDQTSAKAGLKVYAGIIKFFKNAWRNITQDPFILECVGGVKVRFDERVQQKSLPQPFIAKNQVDFDLMLGAVDRLLSIGAIRVCNQNKDQFLSSCFLVKKSDGTHRFVPNLKKLSSFICTKHFKMEDHRTAAQLMTLGIFMAKVDLKDAYLNIPLHKSSCKYFRFFFNGCLYEFTVIPFGFNEAPYLFTKILRPAFVIFEKKVFLRFITWTIFSSLANQQRFVPVM